MKFLAFCGRRETTTGFEDEREGVIIRQDIILTHEIVDGDCTFRRRAVTVGSEHEVPSEDVRILDLKENGARKGKIKIMRERVEKDFTRYKRVRELARDDGVT